MELAGEWDRALARHSTGRRTGTTGSQRKVVVLSRGMKECLHVPRETLDFLKEREVAAHVLPTAEAVKLYNELAEKELVGGLFHTTC